MGKAKYDIQTECPNCGKVRIGREQFASASYDESGWIRITFGCPTCDAKVEFKCKLDDETVNDLTAHALASMNAAMSKGGKSDANDGGHSVGEGEGESCGRAETACGEDRREGREAGAAGEAGAGSAEKDSAQAADPSAKGETPLSINYMAMGGDSMVTFGIELESKREVAGGLHEERKPHEPTDEDKARLEYFHRQLESLDTVDDAIDEIESGYHLGDEDEGE